MDCNGIQTSPSSSFPTNFMFQIQSSNDQDVHGAHQFPNPVLNPLHDFTGRMPFSMSAMEAGDGGGGAGDDEVSDEYCSHVGEKKKRLNIEQVRALEKNFEQGNKLEPERKMRLAQTLGLQPRQVAIWFQNRRARWKTKQMERDYDVLKKQFQAIKSENDSLLAENKKLHAEIMALKGRSAEAADQLINLNAETAEASLRNPQNVKSLEINFTETAAMAAATETAAMHARRSGFTFYPAGRPAASTELEHLLHTSSASHSIAQGGGGGGYGESLCTNAGEQSLFWPWPTDHRQIN